MSNYIIKPMQTESEMDGKGHVHYQSYQEAYTGLMDAEYLSSMSEEKCKEIAHKWPENLLVAKDGEKVIGFVGYGNTMMIHLQIAARCSASMCLLITTEKRSAMS